MKANIDSTQMMQDMSWMSKLSEKEWQSYKKRMIELFELMAYESIKMAKKFQDEIG